MIAPTAPHPQHVDGLAITPLEDGGCKIEVAGQEKIHYLNNTAAVILLLCDGQRSAAEISAELRREYDLDHTPDEDVREMVDDFVKEGLVRMS